MADKQYDRSTQDLGNIVNLGHVNVCITDQHLATHYYVTGLGLTRDPSSIPAPPDVDQCRHEPVPPAERTARRAARRHRAGGARSRRVARSPHPGAQAAGGNQVRLRESNDCVETVCPWGNRINVHAPDENRFGRIVLGMPYIEFDVRPGTAERIARFYREVMGALATVVENGGGRKARVQVGEKQYWYFRETDAPEKPYDRHHAQIYIANFSGPYRAAEGARPHHHRRSTTTSIASRTSSTSTPARCCSPVEHEVRSQTHPLYGRPLVNRNPAQSNRDYKPGHDSMSWAMA